MKILGISCSQWHDPSAALLVDGEIVAATEQERFSRRKHAISELPVDAVQYCLKTAGLRPEDIDLVAYPWSIASIEQNRFAYLARGLGRRTSKSLKTLISARKQQRRRLEKLEDTLAKLGLKASYDGVRGKGTVPVECVEHHLAHASSAYHLSGFDDAAVMTIDGMGEITTCLFGVGSKGRLDKVHEIQKPDSLGLFYASMTEYLGFDANDGEYKVMGMASYGDPSKVDLSGIVTWKDGDLRLDLDYVWSPRDRRYENKVFGKKLVERLGPPRKGDEIDEPYVHVAAATQKVLEDATFALLDYHLKPVLEKTRRLCFAGGCALNVVLNRKLVAHPLIDELWVQPGAGDSGLSLGAATYAASQHGEKIRAQRHCYLGPASTTDEVIRELEGLKIPYERLEDAPARAAELLARGEVVAWFQGRQEWGPRALGNRSILGNPAHKGVADDINGRIKYRERWRPFCPSLLEEKGPEILGTKHPSPFMTHSFKVADAWRDRIPEVVHVDGTLRPQLVSKETNPRYHRLISEFEKRTGLPVVVNTSLNRRGEPIVTTPKDALAMFYGCGLEFLIMEDVLVTKRRS